MRETSLFWLHSLVLMSFFVTFLVYSLPFVCSDYILKKHFYSCKWCSTLPPVSTALNQHSFNYWGTFVNSISILFNSLVNFKNEFVKKIRKLAFLSTKRLIISIFLIFFISYSERNIKIRRDSEYWVYWGFF